MKRFVAIRGLSGANAQSVDEVPGAAATVSDSDATLTGLPSGKTVKIYIVAANDAGQAAPSATVEIVVPWERILK